MTLMEKIILIINILHVRGIVDDDVALLLGSVNPAHHNNPIVLVLSSRPGHEDGLRGEKPGGELLLDCISCVNIHLAASTCLWTISGINMLVDIVGFTFTTAPSSLNTLWEK